MPNLFLEAVVKHLARSVTPSPRTAEQWADVPVAIRERAMFSARVTNTRHLQMIKDTVEQIIALVRQNADLQVRLASYKEAGQLQQRLTEQEQVHHSCDYVQFIPVLITCTLCLVPATGVRTSRDCIEGGKDQARV